MGAAACHAGAANWALRARGTFHSGVRTPPPTLGAAQRIRRPKTKSWPCYFSGWWEVNAGQQGTRPWNWEGRRSRKMLEL